MADGRVKFADLYPDVAPLESPQVREHALMVRGRQTYRCFRCGAETEWLEVSFEAPVCSEECRRAAWEEFFAHERRPQVTLELTRGEVEALRAVLPRAIRRENALKGRCYAARDWQAGGIADDFARSLKGILERLRGPSPGAGEEPFA